MNALKSWKNADETFKYNKKNTLTMILQPEYNFSPSQFAFFPNSHHPAFDLHPSASFLAFTTRDHQIIIANQKTGRTISLHQSQHGIISLKFTNQYLLAIEKTVHQILIFSLKNLKLKKRLAGHRSQITSLAYCRQRQLFTSISHDVCLVWNEKTFSKEKTLKCSTSSFIDCTFTESGQFLFTAFKDSTVLIWNVSDFTYQQIAFDGNDVQIAANNSSILACYNKLTLYLIDLSKEVKIMEKVEPFWKGNIKNIGFLGTILAMSTDESFYLCQIHQQHKFIVEDIKEIQQGINSFTTGSYGSLLLILNNNFKQFSVMKVQNDVSSKYEIINNPLTNEGLYCAGGYSNTNGCLVHVDLKTTNKYSASNNEVENICISNYTGHSQFSPQKLKEFLSKRHSLPDKHRPAALKYLLKLPINPKQFRWLQNKGRHECTELLDTKYPLQNKKLSEIMKNMISLLSHYHPIFAEDEHIPSIIFPFILLFGNDQYLCFEVLYRLFTNWLSFLFVEFPVANSKYLQNLYEILAKVDIQLLNHLKMKKISFTKLCWGLLSNFFTTNLPRQAFLSLLDNIFIRPSQPQYVMFVCLGFIEYNRIRICSLENQSQLQTFLENQQTVHIPKLINTINTLHINYMHHVTYQFQTFSFQVKKYEALTKIPKDTIKMYEGRRKLQTEQYRKIKQQECYKEKMLDEMERMTVMAKKNAQKAIIAKESYDILNEQEANKQFKYEKVDRKQRINKIQHLIDQLTTAIEHQTINHSSVKQVLPSFANFEVQSDKELDNIQLKLMELLTSLKPYTFGKPMKNQPFSLLKNHVNSQEALKSAFNAKTANLLWEVDQLQAKKQEHLWENNMLRAMKP